MRYFLKMLCQLFNKDIMKITKARLEKARNANNQTRKKYKSNKKLLTHTNTFRNRKPFNLRNNTIKNYINNK